MPLTPEEIAESLAEADRLYEQYRQELAALDRGEELPPLDPATVSMPNLQNRKEEGTAP